jgi:hypothetical protein
MLDGMVCWARTCTESTVHGVIRASAIPGGGFMLGKIDPAVPYPPRTVQYHRYEGAVAPSCYHDYGWVDIW